MFLGRIVGPEDPAWTVEDREWAIAHHLEESSRCECGEPRSVSTNPNSDGWYKATAIRCFACAARDREGRRFASSSTDRSSQDGLKLAITDRPSGD